MPRRLRSARAAPIDGPHGVADNAVAESFFATLKVELVDRCPYRTRAQARASIFHWIAWYSQRLPAATGVGTAAWLCPPATIDPGRIATVSDSRGEVHVAQGKLKPEKLVSHWFTFDTVMEAHDTFGRTERGHPALTPPPPTGPIRSQVAR